MLPSQTFPLFNSFPYLPLLSPLPAFPFLPSSASHFPLLIAISLPLILSSPPTGLPFQLLPCPVAFCPFKLLYPVCIFLTAPLLPVALLIYILPLLTLFRAGLPDSESGLRCT